MKQDQNYWTSADIKKILRTEKKFKSLQTLYNAEDKGEIPKAIRVPRGRVDVRHWPLDQIPEIGRKFGFLSPPASQKIICTYIQKGGVLKTTLTFNIAQTLALNGVKVLIIGLDFECSITDILFSQEIVQNLDNNKRPLGLFHYLAENADINSVILKTHLPTLDLIPETHDLVIFNKWLNQQQRREYIFKDKLIPFLKNYDVIIFDNGPSWNHIIENALSCSDCILSPLGCNLLSYNATETNLSSIFDYQELMGLHNQKIIMVATLLERSSLSQQIFAKYLNRFADYIIPTPIRSYVKMQEALAEKKTILEASPNSSVAQDFYELMTSFWEKLNT